MSFWLLVLEIFLVVFIDFFVILDFYNLTTVIIAVSTVTMSLLESFLPLWLIGEIRPPRWELGVVFIPDSVGYLIGTNLFNLFYISLEYRYYLD